MSFKKDSDGMPRHIHECNDCKPRHSPTPWTWEPAFRILRGNHGGEVGYSLPFIPEDAAFIVRAANCHDELLDLAKWVHDSFKADERPDYVDALIKKAEGY